MKKYRFIISGFILLLISLWGYNEFMNSKKNRKRVVRKSEKTAYIEVVENKDIPIIIQEKGTLKAKNRMLLFSEVQGVLEESNKEFRAGVSFKKGEVLLSVNADEHKATLKAQKSVFQNLIVSIIPDLRMDYPNSFEKWENYLKDFDVNKNINSLPEANSDKEKYFITAKNIYTTYYNIKNLEVRLEKYNIRAPYDGVVIEANVNNGALVRPGQRMGEFINTEVYELALSVNAAFANDLRVGKKVHLNNLEKTIEATGKVVRIGGKIDSTSQTIEVYVELQGNQLKEGMYLEANLFARNVVNAFEISRKLLINKESVFVLKDSVLALTAVTPIYFKEKTIIVKGLENGLKLVSKPILGAFEGMPVKELNAIK